MRRFFILRQREHGVGMYVAEGDPVERFLYLSYPWDYSAENPYTHSWSTNRSGAANIFFDPECYVEVTAEHLSRLNTPEFLDRYTTYTDRRTLPALSNLAPIAPRRIRVSNTTHKIGVPKNKLP